MAKLPPEKYGEAYSRILAAQSRGETELTCPVCEKPGAVYIDQSARPVAEWYQLTCPSCGLTATVGVASRPIGG